MNAPCRADKGPAVNESRLEVHSSAHQVDDNQKNDHRHEKSVHLCEMTDHDLFIDLMFDSYSYDFFF